MAESGAEKKSYSSSAPTRKGYQRSGEKRLKQLLTVVVLLICCVASFYFFRNTMMLESSDEYQDDSASMPDPEVTKEIGEIEATEKDMVSMGKASSLAMQTALLAEVSGRYPLSPTSTLVPPEPPKPPEAIAEEIIEPDPPQVTVVAIMITGDDTVAMVDVLGEDGGLIVRKGSSFSNGTAKITKIDAKGVTFTWMKKSYTVSM
ncbi:MAG: hypothetical protein LBQ56_03600 [Synergistaceae bacterium]|jgi:hypothetical protein|nr:hypothetical protein [Synergistaceae bacterium]